jgi:hypothetical protein
MMQEPNFSIARSALLGVHLKMELEEYLKMSAEDNRDVTVLQ